MANRIGISFLTLAAISFIAGLWSLSWNERTGHLIHWSGSTVSSGEGYYTRSYARPIGSGSFTRKTASYTYAANSSTYTGSLICLCIPVGVEEPASSEGTIKIYTMPGIPSMAVIRPGPDLFITSLFIVIGLLGLSFRSERRAR